MTASHLQNNGLVHEAFQACGRKVSPGERPDLFGIAAQLCAGFVDHAATAMQPCGAGVTRLSLDPSICEARSNREDVDLLALNEALDRLAKLDAQQSSIVELRYFGGLTVEDTSEFLGISPATVKRSWSSARLWLRREMTRPRASA